MPILSALRPVAAAAWAGLCSAQLLTRSRANPLHRCWCFIRNSIESNPSCQDKTQSWQLRVCEMTAARKGASTPRGKEELAPPAPKAPLPAPPRGDIHFRELSREEIEAMLLRNNVGRIAFS